VEWGHTGPRSLRAVSSRTFSMFDFEGSRGRGRPIVALLPVSPSPMVESSGVPEIYVGSLYEGSLSLIWRSEPSSIPRGIRHRTVLGCIDEKLEKVEEKSFR